MQLKRCFIQTTDIGRFIYITVDILAIIFITGKKAPYTWEQSQMQSYSTQFCRGTVDSDFSDVLFILQKKEANS